MIFPDKPRPPWQYQKPPAAGPKARAEQISDTEPRKQPRPPGYYRERIEFAVIIVGFYFWIKYWLQYQ